MKRFLSAISALLIVTSALAGPASRRPFIYHQPDGSPITLVRHGDENRHWTTTVDGTRVERDADGFYRPAGSAPAPTLASVPARRAPKSAKTSLSLGEKHFLVLLIDFPDLHFKTQNARSAFSSMLNAHGYSDNGGTGSARDYFLENSNGSFRPVFDVYGPVTVDNPYAYYGENDRAGDDKRPDFLLYEACQKLDSKVDFSLYDNDGDGTVDNLFFYYAGHNEAEGADEDTIWPHSWAFTRFKAFLDGVQLQNYACTSELSGNTGVRMCGIGTFCHEFSHTLGLMDFYDSDYEDNGLYDPDDVFDLMHRGNYNNDGRTPPYLNAYERYLLGWQEFPSVPSKLGTARIAPVQEGGGMAVTTSEEGEFFIIETRNGKGWDSHAGSGCLIYHVDRSGNPVDGIPAADRWNDNTINCVASHPCFSLVDAPLQPWYGTLDFGISDIRYAGGVTSLLVSGAASSYISGIVSDADGTPLEMACVGHGQGVVQTDSDGRFIIPASGVEKIVVSCAGYETRELGVKAGETADVKLSRAASFSCIRVPSSLVHGTPVTFEFVPSGTPVPVVWYIDSTEATLPFVFPAAGEYEIRAEVICPDGTKESVRQIVRVL